MNSSIKAKLTIRLTAQQLLMTVLLFIFLFAPDDLFKATGFYTSATPYDIPYKWLNYSFSYLYFIPICFGLLIALAQKKVRLIFFPVLLLLRSFFRYIAGFENIIEAGTYEIILTVIVGTCLFIWVQYMIQTERVVSQQKFFIVFVIIHVASQLVSFAYSLSRFTTRYNAINLDVECTGLLCGFAFLYVFISRNLNNRSLLLVLFGIGALLSGARIPIVIALTLLVTYIFFSKKQLRAHANIGHMALTVIIIIAVVIAVTVAPDYIESMIGRGLFSSVSRIADFSTNGDPSSIGRINSLSAGIEVLKENPFGLDCGYIFLQRRMYRHGYPTFPHSLLLTYYLLFGPFCLFLIIYSWGRKIRYSLKELKHERNEVLSSSVLFGYLVLFAILTGGPIVNYKVIFIYLMLVSVASLNYEPEETISTNSISD